MHLFSRFCISLILFFLGSNAIQAQTDTAWLKPYTSDIQDFSIGNQEDKVSITSQTPLLIRDAPGTVSVITEDDIQSNGARDLSDILRLIPGFELTMDVQGVVGLGVRGFSANEAIVVLVDGMEMNELLYGSNQFGHRLPIDQIRRIEVVRGPGSVVYGGLAVFAVINILTKASEWHNGLRISQTLGETDKGMARRAFSGSLGQTWDNTKISVTGSLTDGNRSDRLYTDKSGQSYNMFDNSRISSRFLSFGLRHKNFFLKGLADGYKMMVRDHQTEISSRPYPLNFSTFLLEARYEWNPTARITIYPFINFKNQRPWATPNEVDSVDVDKVIVYKINVMRLQSGFNMVWKPRTNLDVQWSGYYTNDRSTDKLNPDSLSESATFGCISFLNQTTWKTQWANFTFGLRFDHHSYYRPILSPRFAVNRSFGSWYLKGSANRSFRTPALSNISLSLDSRINPQITDCFEVEAGFNPNPDLHLTMNLYRILVEDGIVYSVLEDGFTEGYSNAGKMGNQGVEFEARYNKSRWYLHTGYAFYTNAGLPKYQTYSVPGNSVNLALPGHKLTFQIRYRTGKRTRLQSSFFYLSERFGFNGSDLAPDYIRYDPVFQWNLFLQTRDIWIKGLQLGVGINDITNSRYNYIQPYRSGHMPLPAMSREYVVKITYSIQTLR
jgi:outer membrane cobalamin receptor